MRRVAILFFVLVVAVSTASSQELLSFSSLSYEGNAPTCSMPCSSSQSDVTPIRFLCDPPVCRNWMDVDYLQFWSDGYRVPGLVTESVAGTPRADAGVLGLPTTNTLLGNETLGDDSRSGLRLSFGRWLDECGDLALTGSFFLLGNGGSSQTFPSDPNTIVSRPFFNVDPAVNAPDSELVNFPGVVAGTVSVSSSSDVFSGGVGIQKKLFCCGDRQCCSARRVDAYMGYRVFAFDETLTIEETLFPSGGFVPAGTQIDVIDRFATENRFHGVQFGLKGTWQRRKWLFETNSNFAIGNVQQRVIIDGRTTTSVPGFAPAVQPYGILAQASNIGTYERNRLGLLTDTYVGVAYQMNCRLKLRAGYNLIFLNSVARPGRQIDTTVNGTQFDPNVPVSGPLHPTFTWRDSESLLLHGIRLGAEFTF